MTLTFDYITDMHHEHWAHTNPDRCDVYNYAAHKQNDMAVVNGDLMTDTHRGLKMLAHIASIYETVVYVDGNHDYRFGTEPPFLYNYDFRAVQKTLREGIAKMPNVTYLAAKPFVKDGIAIIGRNGHWDYELIKTRHTTKKKSIEAAIKPVMAKNFNQAASFIKLARQDYCNLRHELTAFTQDPSIHTIVVVTHTVPRVELINFSSLAPHEHNNRMGSGIMRDVLDSDVNGKVKLWLFGHQHGWMTKTLNGVVYHENANGFSWDNLRGSINDYEPSRITVGKGVCEIVSTDPAPRVLPSPPSMSA